jgi:hypothetical protein
MAPKQRAFFSNDLLDNRLQYPEQVMLGKRAAAKQI